MLTPGVMIEVIDFWENGVEYYFHGCELWKEFRAHFEGLVEDDFKSISHREKREFRDYLRRRGVWVQKHNKIPIAKALCNCYETWTEWPANEPIDPPLDQPLAIDSLIQQFRQQFHQPKPQQASPTPDTTTNQPPQHVQPKASASNPQ